MLVLHGVAAVVASVVLALLPTGRPDVVPSEPRVAAPPAVALHTPHRLVELRRAQERVMAAAPRRGVEISYVMRSRDRTHLRAFVGRAELARHDRAMLAQLLTRVAGLPVVVRHGEPIIFQ